MKLSSVRNKIKRNKTMKPTTGYIYVLTNEAFKDDIIKIGYAEDVSQRLLSLNNTSVPYNFKVVLTYKVYKNKIDEQVHKFFSRERLNSAREFFRLSVTDIISIFKFCAKYTDTEDRLDIKEDFQAIKTKEFFGKNTRYEQLATLLATDHYGNSSVNLFKDADNVLLTYKDFKAEIRQHRNKIIEYTKKERWEYVRLILPDITAKYLKLKINDLDLFNLLHKKTTVATQAIVKYEKQFKQFKRNK